MTDSRWNRNAVCRSSWNLEEILRPSSRRKSTADSLIGPSVSTAISCIENEAGRSEYLTSFLEAAASAAAAAVVVVDGGRILTRRPYRVRRDISTALPGSSVTMLLTLPKISCRVASVPGHSVSQCSTVFGFSPHLGQTGSTVGSIKCWYALNLLQ